MSKRKPLSAEEKRIKLLELFHETNDVFSLKDLERLAPKEKGIIMQSVKGTLEVLIDECQVYCEKIAGTTYYWSFYSDALNSKKALLENSVSTEKELQTKITNAENHLAATMVASEHAKEIISQEAEIDLLKKEKEELQQRLASLETNIDYARIQAKELSLDKIREAANRWTDNIFAIRSWCKRNFGADDNQINSNFGIKNDLDYLSE